MKPEETIFVKILLPSKPFLTKEVLSVEIPAKQGPYLVLTQRAPCLKLLKNGVMKIKNINEEKEELFFISEGVTKIRENECTIITSEAFKLEEINLEEIYSKIKVYEKKEKRKSHLDAVDEKYVNFLKSIVGYFANKNA